MIENIKKFIANTNKKISSVRKILVKKRVCRLAGKFIKKELGRKFELCYEKQEVGESEYFDKYYTSIIKNGEIPYVYVNGKVMWPDDKVTCRYANQVLEIEQVHRNIKQLESVINSKKVGNVSTARAQTFKNVLEKALKVFKSGQDNQEFESSVTSLNEFVENHIVYRRFHKTFRVVTHNEDEFQRFGPTMIANYRLVQLQEQEKYFDSLLVGQQEQKTDKSEKQTEKSL